MLLVNYMVEINKVYWITHPAFPMIFGPLGNERIGRNSPASIRQFIKKEIYPVIQKAAGEPKSVVVLVRTPSKKDSRTRKAIAIETVLERLMHEKLENRAIVTRQMDENIAANEVRTHFKKNELILSKSPVIEAYGSWKEWCSKTYPKIFKAKHGNRGTLVQPKKGNIAVEPRIKRILESRRRV